MHVEENSVVIKFVESRSHLTVKDRYGYLKGFAIAGADRKFHWARARLQDNRVTVSSPQVKKPVAVRYAWGNNPDDANLYNQDNLPALPFRTDDWPGITGPGSVKKPEGK
jgi:sialate O-acetylesterase